MTASRLSLHVVVASLLAQAALSCLPQDTRPTPASLLVTASSNDATQHGFDTEDGWHVDFTKFLVSMGNASLSEGSSCTPYTRAGYQRVLDVLRPEEQKVNLIYGLGSCELEFSVAYPTVEDSLPGAGVSEEDMLFMRTQFSDRFASKVGINGYISGGARKLTQVKTFSWFFRQNWSYSGCWDQADAGGTASIPLSGGTAVSVNLTVHGEDLFRNVNQSNQWTLLFEPMAQADSRFGDGDGYVALDELRNVAGPLPSTMASNADVAPDTPANDAGLELAAADAGSPIPNDLEFAVYTMLYPSMFHYGDSGQCKVTMGRNRRRE
jgi:hypothetical protein